MQNSPKLLLKQSEQEKGNASHNKSEESVLMFNCQDLISDESLTTVNEKENFSEVTHIAMQNMQTKSHEE